jgi:hypothetical protein
MAPTQKVCRTFPKGISRYSSLWSLLPTSTNTANHSSAVSTETHSTSAATVAVVAAATAKNFMAKSTRLMPDHAPRLASEKRFDTGSAYQGNAS